MRISPPLPLKSLSLLIPAMTLLAAMACGHTPNSVPSGLQKALENPAAPSLNVTSLGIQLTQQGSNDSPFLSPDGKKVVFVSRKRPTHQQGQVYVYDMDSLKEKRITYQDGECRDPIFLSDSKRIVYASTTDELKENPLLLHPSEAAAPYPMTDLYSSDLSGSDIQRLTQQNGFDGFPWPRPDHPQSITFSRLVDNRLTSFQLNLESRQSIPLLAKKDIAIESLRLSPDKKQWIWIERNSTGGTQVLTAPFNFSPNKQQTLGLPTGDYKEILWMSPQKILLTAKIQKKYDQFYTWDFEKKCLQSLFTSTTDVSSPRLHSERQGLVYASSSNGSSQIFYKSLPAGTNENSCLPLSSDAKTK